MEVIGGYRNKKVVCYCEAIGTGFLLLAVNWGGAKGKIPEAVGFTVFMMIQMFGSISGGHFNPAVTTGMFIKQFGFNWRNRKWMSNAIFADLISISQFVGGAIGLAVCVLAFPLTES